MIPHRINHIWLQGEIPEKYEENFQKWEEFHPDWEHTVWDEISLLDLCTSKQKLKYEKLDTLINRVNFLKYILMYHVGGVYVDLDTYPVQDLLKFFSRTKVDDINLSNLLSIRFPFTCEIPEKSFESYNIILPGRKSLSYYPNGDNIVLIDNPVLMSSIKNNFWLELIDHCSKRNNLKDGGLSNTKFLPHEPYGPYGISDFIYQKYKRNNPYLYNILILPPIYFLNDSIIPNKNMFIFHNADRGW